MSLLLEALKRAERAKKQQNIDEITAALEDNTLPDAVSAPVITPSPLALDPLASLPASPQALDDTTALPTLDALPTLLDFPLPTADEPLSLTAAPLTANDVPSGNALEFKLDAFDLPPVQAAPQPAVEAAPAASGLDWSAVEL